MYNIHIYPMTYSIETTIFDHQIPECGKPNNHPINQPFEDHFTLSHC